jgi:hypothetical protein
MGWCRVRSGHVGCDSMTPTTSYDDSFPSIVLVGDRLRILLYSDFAIRQTRPLETSCARAEICTPVDYRY